MDTNGHELWNKEQITDLERGQMINYLKITKLRVGVILNFTHPNLEWERIVL
jgi:GxxExxY protein